MYDLQPNMDSDLYRCLFKMQLYPVAINAIHGKEDLVVPVISTTGC
jgi:hypothetical protein